MRTRTTYHRVLYCANLMGSDLVAAAKGIGHHESDPLPRQGKQQLCAVISGVGRDRPYLWTVVEGSLPPGVTLDENAGLLTGTPTQAGAFQVQMQVTDASVSPYTTQPQAHIQSFTFVINP
jgi:hypothetical protein